MFRYIILSLVFSFLALPLCLSFDLAWLGCWIVPWPNHNHSQSRGIFISCAMPACVELERLRFSPRRISSHTFLKVSFSLPAKDRKYLLTWKLFWVCAFKFTALFTHWIHLLRSAHRPTHTVTDGFLNTNRETRSIINSREKESRVYNWDQLPQNFQLLPCPWLFKNVFLPEGKNILIFWVKVWNITFTMT